MVEEKSFLERVLALAQAHEARMAGRRERELVTRPVDPDRIRAHLARRYAFDAPHPLGEVTADVLTMLERWGVQVTHPRYFGLFNPSVPGAAVVGAALRAHFNPQLATWTHAAAASEMERHLLRALAARLGFEPDTAHATFTTGGQESNLSALRMAMTRAFPSIADRGLRALEREPVLYASEEAHHSLEKAAVGLGLGRAALRVVPVDRGTLAMDVEALRAAIAEDRARGAAPFFVAATAGTTSSGAIDPIAQLAAIARGEALWLHVDAAYGGGALLVPELRAALAGIEQADSVTWDAHKWLSVPMGAGMLFTRHAALAEATFATRSGYMPAPRAGTGDPYVTTLQWSRRFIGLELFLALAELGWSGLEARVEHQAAMGERLRARLVERGYLLRHPSRLPVVCFTHPRIEAGEVSAGAVVRRVHARGRAWLSLVRLPGPRKALRACVTSYLTEPRDLEALIDEVDRALTA